MPLFDLNGPTELLFQWGWLLVTKANAVVYILVVLVFLAGMFVRLPRARRDIAAVEGSWSTSSSNDTKDGAS